MTSRVLTRAYRLATALCVFSVGAAAWAEEAAKESGGGGDILGTLGIDWRTVIGQLFTFALLYWIFKKYLWGPVLAILQTRQQEVHSIYSSAEDAQAKAESARKEYEARLAQADEESRKRIAEALTQANVMKDEIIASARQQADRIIASGNETVRQEMEKAQVQIRESATRMAVDLAGRIIQQNITAESQRSLIDRFIEGVGQPQ